jgi:hypothetical protein
VERCHAVVDVLVLVRTVDLTKAFGQSFSSIAREIIEILFSAPVGHEKALSIAIATDNDRTGPERLSGTTPPEDNPMFGILGPIDNINIGRPKALRDDIPKVQILTGIDVVFTNPS